MTGGAAWGQMAAKAVDQLIDIGSTYFGNQSNRHAQRRSYDYASALQQQAQNWAEYMSNTAHQREMEDLRAAGLNPLLTATGGNGAMSYSSTAGTAIGQAPALQAKSDMLSAVNTAKQLKLQEKMTNASSALQEEQAMTEISKRQNLYSQSVLNEAKSMEAQANAILTDKYSNWVDREKAQLIKKMASDITLNSATTALQRSNILQNEANIKFTNERSRGFGIIENIERNIDASYKSNGLAKYLLKNYYNTYNK